MGRKKLPFHMEHWQFISLLLGIYDAIAIAFSYIFALLLRFDLQFSQIPSGYYEGYKKFIPFYIIICLVIFRKLRLYNSIWRFGMLCYQVSQVTNFQLCKYWPLFSFLLGNGFFFEINVVSSQRKIKHFFII
jgi:FlaA1/EpsC-like NDP-sugar epimerase